MRCLFFQSEGIFIVPHLLWQSPGFRRPILRQAGCTEDWRGPNLHGIYRRWYTTVGKARNCKFFIFSHQAQWDLVMGQQPLNFLHNLQTDNMYQKWTWTAWNCVISWPWGQGNCTQNHTGQEMKMLYFANIFYSAAMHKPRIN